MHFPDELFAREQCAERFHVTGRTDEWCTSSSCETEFAGDVVRDGEQPADIAGGEPVRPITHQEPKDLQTRRLRQRAQERDRIGRGQP